MGGLQCLARYSPADRGKSRSATGPARHTPIGTVVLINADVDHITGLLFEGTVFEDDEMRRADVGEKTGARMAIWRFPARTDLSTLSAISPTVDASSCT
ncbi:hypothetical protein [Breoghania sp.]|uniref:hypothetical protein n=1 Tax=Breoghania sp. TaxID=2065378 RepID=UPI003204D924